MGEDPLSRRRVLGGIAGGLTAGATIDWLLPDPTSSPIPGEVETPDVPETERPMSETDVPYAVYQYASVRGRFRPTLPINVVFPLEGASFHEVVSVFERAGWYPRPSEQVRYAYDRDSDEWRRSDWSGAETVFGVGTRLHVRCWGLDGTASVQAHVDTPPRPEHRIHSFAAAERAVATLFHRDGWRVSPTDPETVSLGNASSPDHDGRATVIYR